MRIFLLSAILIFITILFSSCSRKTDLHIDIDITKRFMLSDYTRVDNAKVEVKALDSYALKELNKNTFKSIKNDIEDGLKRSGVFIGDDLFIQVILESQNYGTSGTVKYFNNKKVLLSEIDIFIDRKNSIVRFLSDEDRGFTKEVVTYAKKHFLKIEKD